MDRRDHRALLLAAALLLPLCALACTSQTNDDFENPPPGPPATCAASAAVPGCAGGSLGYVCTAGRPDAADTDLVCNDGAPGAGGTAIYCCAPYGQYWSECTVDTGVPGCVAESFGFRCSGPETPAEADASLACSAGTPSGSDTLFCCSSAVLAPTCAPDPTIEACASPSIGYACAGSTTPADLDPAFQCGTVAAGLFCCD